MLVEGLAVFGALWFVLPVVLRATILAPRRCTSKKRLDGKVTLITGANTGLGKENAIDFARRGAKVYMACRNIEKAETAKRDILNLYPNAELIIIKLDLCSLESTAACVDEYLKHEDHLDILVANAGFGNFLKHDKTEDGIEWHLGANHLAHFVLVRKLLPALEKAGSSEEKSRVVVLSSNGHKAVSQGIDYEGLQAGKTVFLAYMHSKLANVLFTRKLSKLLEGKNVTANSLHPGAVRTEFVRNTLPGIWEPIVFGLIFPLYWLCKNSIEGTQTQIFAAVDESMEGVTGKYLDNCRIVEPSAAAQDDEGAEKLWRWSCEKTGLSYDL